MSVLQKAIELLVFGHIDELNAYVHDNIIPKLLKRQRHPFIKHAANAR